MPNEKDKWVLPRNKHAYAFYHYCKKQGDIIRLIPVGDSVTIILFRRGAS